MICQVSQSRVICDHGNFYQIVYSIDSCAVILLTQLSYNFRKRKKDLSNEKLVETPDTPEKVAVLPKMLKVNKAKDSDDEDYMLWKKPDSHAPIVTFSPPAEEPVASSSFECKPNVLTRNRLEKFNVRNKEENKQVPRVSLGDGDDGFESLNGNNSNGSDGEHRARDHQKQEKAPAAKVTEQVIPEDKTDSCQEINEDLSEKLLEKDSKDKVKEVDSDGVTPTSPSSTGKRASVRFRKSWIQEMIDHDSTDEDHFRTNKGKIKVIIILL